MPFPHSIPLPCIFFQSNKCKEGLDCRFLHITPTTTDSLRCISPNIKDSSSKGSALSSLSTSKDGNSTSTSTCTENTTIITAVGNANPIKLARPCQFFLDKTCKYGSFCAYQHEFVPEPTNVMSGNGFNAGLGAMSRPARPPGLSAQQPVIKQEPGLSLGFAFGSRVGDLNGGGGRPGERGGGGRNADATEELRKRLKVIQITGLNRPSMSNGGQRLSPPQAPRAMLPPRPSSSFHTTAAALPKPKKPSPADALKNTYIATLRKAYDGRVPNPINNKLQVEFNAAFRGGDQRAIERFNIRWSLEEIRKRRDMGEGREKWEVESKKTANLDEMRREQMGHVGKNVPTAPNRREKKLKWREANASRKAASAIPAVPVLALPATMPMHAPGLPMPMPPPPHMMEALAAPLTMGTNRPPTPLPEPTTTSTTLIDLSDLKPALATGKQLKRRVRDQGTSEYIGYVFPTYSRDEYYHFRTLESWNTILPETIISIHFCRDFILGDYHITRLLEQTFLCQRLQSLQVSTGCEAFLTETNILEFAQECPNLRVLIPPVTAIFSPSTLLSILSFCPKLEALHVSILPGTIITIMAHLDADSHLSPALRSLKLIDHKGIPAETEFEDFRGACRKVTANRDLLVTVGDIRAVSRSGKGLVGFAVGGEVSVVWEPEGYVREDEGSPEPEVQLETETEAGGSGMDMDQERARSAPAVSKAEELRGDLEVGMAGTGVSAGAEQFWAELMEGGVNLNPEGPGSASVEERQPEVGLVRIKVEHDAVMMDG